MSASNVNAKKTVKTPKVGMVSLGCPKELVDSERILSQLRSEGYEISGSYDGADVVIVNTCGFLDSAKAESLEAIGKGMAENGKVIVTGCMGAEPEQIREAYPAVSAITGPQAYESVMNAVHEVAPPLHNPFLDLVPEQGVKLTPRHYAYLKISEGCNNRCTFCIIPKLRGDLVSRPLADVMREAEKLVKAGVKELLVISQDTSAYGVDPPPVRRVHIPKGDGSTRPIGIPTVEDKVLQQAVRMILEVIYEEEFVGLSYGFRPGRSPHRALDALAFTITTKKVNWVLDADIRSFFDTIDHGWLRQFIEHRIGDQRLVWLLMKWLHAGVMEDGELRESSEGTPQGGGISPLLANVFLHYALDLWVLWWRKRQARGEMYVVRYADDFVMGLQFEEDARVMRTALAERLARFGLELHPDKTRVIRFGRFSLKDAERDGLTKPATFDFLGFTHISGEKRKRGEVDHLHARLAARRPL